MDSAISNAQATATPQYAVGKTFWPRAGAYIIDSIVFVLVNFVTAMVIGFVIGVIYAILTGQAPDFSGQQNRLLDFVISFAMMIVYFALFEWLYGATPGKLILGMRVVKEDGSPCSLGAALLRGVLRLFDGLFFGLIAASRMKFPLYQRYGDLAADTIVVRSKDEIIQKPRAWWWLLIAAGLYLAIETITTTLRIVRLLN